MSDASTGLLIALVTTVSWSIGIFPFTEAARRLGVNSLNHFRLLLATIMLLLLSVIIDSGSFIRIFTVEYLDGWIWLGLSGLTGLALGDYFAFKMYAILGARKGSVLTTFAPAAALIFGKVLLHEKINFIGVAGIIITILGVISVSFGRRERIKITGNTHGGLATGIFTGIMAALCQGAGLVMAKKGFQMQDLHTSILNPVHATFMRMVVSFLTLSLITLISGRTRAVLSPVLTNKESGLKFAVAGTFFGPFLGVCLSLVTIKFIDAAVAQTIFSLVPVVALAIAFIFYKEKISIQSIIGILIALTGVFILIWRNNIFLIFTG